MWKSSPRLAQEWSLSEGKFIAEQVVQVPPGTTAEQVGTMIVKIRNQFGIQEVSLFNMQRLQPQMLLRTLLKRTASLF